MSTEPRPRNGLVLTAACAAAAGLAACAGPAPSPGHSFAEVRLTHPPPAPEPAYLQPPSLPERAAAPVALDPTVAEARVRALLMKDGFRVEAAAGGSSLIGTRMGAPDALRGEAACALKAMHRPDFSASDLDVRFAPAGRTAQVSAAARFVLVDTNLISGDLTRQKCRSTGALEAAVRRAAGG